MATKISLERIVELRVPVSWQEAVVVARVTAERADQQGVVPGLDSVMVDITGDIELAGSSRRPFLADPRPEILNVLIDRTQAPPELVALAATGDALGSSRDDIAKHLDFFARPDAADLLSDLARRALAMDMAAQAEGEFARLRDVKAPIAAKRTHPQPRATFVRSPLLVGALVGVAVLGVAVFAARLALQDDTSASSSPRQFLATTSSSIDAALDSALRTIGLSAPLEPAPPVALVVPTQQAEPTTTAPSVKPLLVPSAPAAVAPIVTVLKDVDASRPTPVDAPSAPADAYAVYDGSDPSVEPPVLVRPQLRIVDATEGSTNRGPYLELLVNAEGMVEKVRLESPRPSVRELMLMSAAKAWAFQPATKNNRPVSYTMRFPLPQ